jgi:hypothetical protein
MNIVGTLRFLERNTNVDRKFKTYVDGRSGSCSSVCSTKL